MVGKLKINGTDAYTMWGAVLEDGSYEKLLSGDAMKDYTINQSRSLDGVEVLIKNPRMKERTITLTFLLIGTSFLSQFSAFLETLQSGLIHLNVPELNKTYKLIYEANTSVTQIRLTMGKVSVKFLEPKPNDR